MKTFMFAVCSMLQSNAGDHSCFCNIAVPALKHFYCWALAVEDVKRVFPLYRFGNVEFVAGVLELARVLAAEPRVSVEVLHKEK